MAASQLGYTVFRNNTGVAWQGNKIKKNKDGSITIFDPRPVHFGLTKGSADLIGWNNSNGLFTALEIKRPGKKPTKEQEIFISRVNQVGGIACSVTSVDELKNYLTSVP